MGKPGYHNRTRSLLHKGSTMLYVAQSQCLLTGKVAVQVRVAGFLGKRIINSSGRALFSA